MPREVTVAELYRDISLSSGSRLQGEKARTEAKKDPVVGLTRPLVHNEGRVFFYCGLLYGFCRLDASITERFREQTGSTLRTIQHITEHPIVVIPWFPDFVKTNVAHCLQSCEAGQEQTNLFDFISSQLIVDRKRGVVWGVKMVPTKIPDPVMLANKEVPSAADVIMFLPYRFDSGFSVVPKSAMLVGTPEIHKVTLNDPELKKKTEEALNAK